MNRFAVDGSGSLFPRGHEGRSMLAALAGVVDVATIGRKRTAH